MPASAGYDRHITVFSPEGRLFQVEYAFDAVKGAGLTSLGIRGPDSFCIVSQRKIPDKLVDPETVTSIFNITPSIVCCTTGRPSDSTLFVNFAREVAASFKHKWGYPIPIDVLATEMGNKAQVYTQYAWIRPFGVIALFGGCDPVEGSKIYRVDPAGHVAGFYAIAAGTKDLEAQNLLEKKMRLGEESGATIDQPVHAALEIMMTLLGEGVRALDLEVVTATTLDPKIKKLTDAEVESLLTEIAERD
ncbi:hypothetical protein RCL1_006977 [Eukaryota sp. TZLM3-RCL]